MARIENNHEAGDQHMCTLTDAPIWFLDGLVPEPYEFIGVGPVIRLSLYVRVRLAHGNTPAIRGPLARATRARRAARSRTRRSCCHVRSQTLSVPLPLHHTRDHL